MFENVSVAPPDAILGLTEAFRADTNSDKVNLVAGVYKDNTGRTPVFAAVKEAERRLLDDETSKSYLPIDGLAEYGSLVQRLLFGDHAIIGEGRAVTIQAPGGTGALRVAGDLLKAVSGSPKIWWSNPTWPNHPQIFDAVGLPSGVYPYFDSATSSLDFDGMMSALRTVGTGEIVLLHGRCHNPSGVDPNPEQWEEIADVIAERGAVPLLDFAYQGFGTGIEEDAVALHALVKKVPELMICSSFSKNFGLYKERVGALTVVTESQASAKAVLSQIKRVVRANYSNPPSHGAAVVTGVLNDPDLRRLWLNELSGMRERIQDVRRRLALGLDARDVRLSPNGNDFITAQNGMFSFSRLNKDQVQALRERFSVYIVASGRMNVAGLTSANIERVCDAIAAVTGS